MSHKSRSKKNVGPESFVISPEQAIVRLREIRTQGEPHAIDVRGPLITGIYTFETKDQATWFSFNRDRCDNWRGIKLLVIEPELTEAELAEGLKPKRGSRPAWARKTAA